MATLFLPSKALPSTPSRPIFGLEICKEMAKVVGETHVDGAMKISGLWRLQVKDRTSRNTLLRTGISLRGTAVTLLGKNPFLVDGEEAMKLIISNIPFSVSNDSIKQALVGKGIKVAGEMQWEKYRETGGGLTSYKTGKRFIHIAPPKDTLPSKVKVADSFTAFLFCPELKRREDEKEESESLNGSESHYESIKAPLFTSSRTSSRTPDSDHTVPKTFEDVGQNAPRSWWDGNPDHQMSGGNPDHQMSGGDFSNRLVSPNMTLCDESFDALVDFLGNSNEVLADDGKKKDVGPNVAETEVNRQRVDIDTLLAAARNFESERGRGRTRTPRRRSVSRSESKRRRSVSSESDNKRPRTNVQTGVQNDVVVNDGSFVVVPCSADYMLPIL